MCSKHKKIRSGITITEVVITMFMAGIVASVVGMLIVSGQRGWNDTYNSAHKQIKHDAYDIMVRFGSQARKANRIDYTIYNITDDIFTPALPQTAEPQEVVSGNAVELRYWDVEFNPENSYELMDATKTATAYALFYLVGNTLKVDYGPYPPGAVPDGGGPINTNGVITTVLAENVSIDANDVGAFSHTTLNGIGQGCVRINIILTDPEDNESIRVMTAALLRNIWPR